MRTGLMMAVLVVLALAGPPARAQVLLESADEAQAQAQRDRDKAQRDRMVSLFIGLCREAGLRPGGPVERAIRGKTMGRSMGGRRTVPARSPAVSKPPVPVSLGSSATLISTPSSSRSVFLYSRRFSRRIVMTPF